MCAHVHVCEFVYTLLWQETCVLLAHIKKQCDPLQIKTYQDWAYGGHWFFPNGDGFRFPQMSKGTLEQEREFGYSYY